MSKADDDAGNWKWGIFYYNPKDKKILVPKRYGIGWTLNFGRTISFIIMGLFLIVVIWTILYNSGITKP